ncbi:MAG: PVC-type heme-binding CxxCH protein, partial [Verrucomicrobiota bacterium]
MRPLKVPRIFSFCATLLAFSIPVFAQPRPINDAELSVKKLVVAPGLGVALFAAEPLLQNPVAFSIDERGRFFISETHRYKDSIFDITRQTNWLLSDLSFRQVEDRAAFLQKEFATNLNFLTKESELVRLVEDRDGDGRAETSSIFADGFNQTVSGTAAGILARKGEVWFTCIPDLWKIASDELQMTNGSANPKTQNAKRKIQNLASGFGVHIGVSGHDLHGLIMGPDGKIYFSCGDRGFSVHTKEGKFLNNPDSGGVLRCNPDGSDMEIFATGLRNPQELAFDQYGNLFTDDNDTAGEDKSRLIYVVEGGDYGWRASYQFMDGYGPWVQEKVWQGGIDGTLPYSGEVAQGPSGLAFYPGTGLPEKYQNHFLVCDFPKGVWSFAVKPKGASYEVIEKEKFLWNLGATDVDFGPDGAAYVSDWGTSYNMPDNGRIYRIFNPQTEARSSRREEAHSNSSSEKIQSLVTSAPTNVKKILAEVMEKRPVEELAQLLGHADMRVRMEAQFALERKSLVVVESLSEVAKTNINPLAQIHALWALKRIWLAQTNRVSLEVTKTLKGTYDALLQNNDPEIRAQALRLLEKRLQIACPDDRSNVRLRDKDPRIRFFAAMNLGKLKSEDGIYFLMTMLGQNADRDPYLVHAGVFALMNLGDGIRLAAKNENASVRRAALLAMRRMEKSEIAQFLGDSESRLVLEAARAINDVPINDAMPQLAAKLNLADATVGTNEQAQILRRSINVNFRLGQNTNAVALANFATKTNTLEAMRVEALDALSDWENPSPLDRVMGLWRPLAKREIAVAQNAFHSVSSELFKS